MGKSCTTLRILQEAADEREHVLGKYSVTQLIKGTREAYLMLTEGYTIDPRNEGLAILGRVGHVAIGDDTESTEQSVSMRLTDEIDIYGTWDNLEYRDGRLKLNDYKFAGSFKVAKSIGLKYNQVPTGERDRYGKPKKVKEFYIDPTTIDMWEWEYQLNMYRIMEERSSVKHIDQLNICTIVRDAGLKVARERGIDKQIHMIPVRIMDDIEVLTWFTMKAGNLHNALKTGTVPPMCSDTWGGTKCKDWCDVSEFCPNNPHLNGRI